MQSKISKAIVAGLTGTLAMTAFMFMGPLMGMPEMNIGEMLGGFMGIPTVIGWMAHFMIGATLALGYAFLFEAHLPGSKLVRGMLYGLLPWLMSQVIVNPMMGAGIFASNTPSPMLMVLGSLLGHLVYGIVVGILYTTKAA
jgi:uncharacterized membrane protein YagU involved in acid resistance